MEDMPRSNSANLPLPPPADYSWSTPARRTQVSTTVHTLLLKSI